MYVGSVEGLGGCFSTVSLQKTIDSYTDLLYTYRLHLFHELTRGMRIAPRFYHVRRY